MKKQYLIIGGVLIAILAVGGIVLASSGSKTTTKSVTKTASAPSYQIREACNILTPAVATELAGPDAASSPNKDNQSGDINVSSCTYYSVGTKTSIALLIRSPKSKAGADSNAYQFTKGLPADAQKVQGYGDSAYWSPSYGQLNIYKNNTWYILSLGSIKSAERTLTQAKQFANMIIDKL